MLSLISNTKSFHDRWIGAPQLVTAGSHSARLRVTQGLRSFRRAMGKKRERASNAEIIRQLDTNGFVTVKNFLPKDTFDSLRAEVQQLAGAVEQDHPIRIGENEGFQPKIDTEFGFDRYDGSTLNRFIQQSAHTMPHVCDFCKNPELNALTSAITGTSFKPRKAWIYQTIHGEEKTVSDPQKQLHRDTFFPSMKFWFYIDPVTEADGPFEYVPTSHKLSKKRLRWEQKMARMAAKLTPGELDGESYEGSFRLNESELANMALPPIKSITAPENTLVIADTFGFHRRGSAASGKRRLAIYGNERPKAFSLFNKK